jgi:hypothetical protein
LVVVVAEHILLTVADCQAVPVVVEAINLLRAEQEHKVQTDRQLVTDSQAEEAVKHGQEQVVVVQVVLAKVLADLIVIRTHAKAT